MNIFTIRESRYQRPRAAERLRRVNYGTLEIEISVNDPKAFARPWAFKLTRRVMPDIELIECVCAENITGGAHLIG